MHRRDYDFGVQLFGETMMDHISCIDGNSKNYYVGSKKGKDKFLSYFLCLFPCEFYHTMAASLNSDFLYFIPSRRNICHRIFYTLV